MSLIFYVGYELKLRPFESKSQKKFSYDFDIMRIITSYMAQNEWLGSGEERMRELEQPNIESSYRKK